MSLDRRAAGRPFPPEVKDLMMQAIAVYGRAHPELRILEFLGGTPCSGRGDGPELVGY